MRRVQRTKHLTIVTFFILLIVIVKPAAALEPIFVGKIADGPADAAAVTMTGALTLNLGLLALLEAEYVEFTRKISADSAKLITIAEQLENNMNSTEKWRNSSDPSEPIHNNALNTALMLPMNQFKKIVNEEKLELSQLEASNFLSSKLSEQKNSAYTFGDTGYNDIIGNEAMCPAPPSNSNLSDSVSSLGSSNPSLTSLTLNYAQLQYDACRTIHNVITYKKRMLALTLEKREQLEKAILAVGDVKDKTIGDHTAKKAVLAELKLLQQEVMDQYNAKMQFADVQIRASEGSRKYAAESIVSGQSVSAKPTNTDGFKLAAELAIQIFMNTYQPSPYH
jgi:hypothetical protein